MFVNAIEKVTEFTRPVHTIQRFFGESKVISGAATLFFVNDEGWALTCRHVAELFIAANLLQQRYQAFKAEQNVLFGKKKRIFKFIIEKVLERKYDFGRGKVVELKNLLVNCIDGPLGLQILLHPELDVALLKFENYTSLLSTSFPIFAVNGDNLKQGRSLCRLGFPFPEFTNFSYESKTDSIDWNDQGRTDTPRFPIDGMVTRHITGPSGAFIGFEMSTPGLRGQSGGPAFDMDGRIWGMQSATNHLDLNFDVDMEVIRNGHKKRISNNAFLHVGHCVHVDVLKSFMREHKVYFAEG